MNIKNDIIYAHKHSSRNKYELLKSEKCGCFYCLKVFYPGEIEEWLDKGETALCPFCGIDSVVGDESGYPIDNDEFLKSMRDYWFKTTFENMD